MSTILEELFPTFADLKLVVPSIGSSVDMEKLNSSAMSAKKQICAIITPQIYQKIISVDGSEEQKSALSQAMANATMVKQVTFDVIEYRKNEVAIYKNEQENMRRSFMEGYYNAMDTLLYLLKDDNSWKETPFAKQQALLIINNADDFNALYPIDSSYLFFFRTMPIQSEIIDDYLFGYFDQAALKKDDKATKRLSRALAQMTVSVAIQRMDPIELPSTIRNLFDDSTAIRSGESEQSRLLDLAKQLMNQATETVKAVDITLNIESMTTTVDVDTSFNQPEDGIFFMG
jgi:hypothetical protein